MLQKISLALIDIYREHLRTLLPCCCRFSPSCSEYTREAILRYGFWRGLTRGARRLLQCHPYSKRPWYDPLI